MSDESPTFRRALEAFDIATFVRRHGGYKESASKHSLEYLVTCPACGSGAREAPAPGAKYGSDSRR